MVEGLLVVDKPAGLTSHEVVAIARRALGERRIGHTGTLDPASTGVLALVLGRATRLARFLSGQDKAYDAVIRLGSSTDTYDADGTVVGAAHQGAWPDRPTIDRALDVFRGTFMQRPPAYSAKKIDGTRSYRVARRAKRESTSTTAVLPELPPAAEVTAHTIEIVHVEGETVSMAVRCSAGFYVRSLAHDLGETLGTGAHLVALRRTHIGSLSLQDAVTVDMLLRDPERARQQVVPLAGMLSDLTAVTLTHEGVVRAVHGRNLGPAETSGRVFAGSPDATLFVRLLDSAGDLVGIATLAGSSGFLHPSVVLK